MWKIVSVNNNTHEVTLSNESRERISLVIPAEHQVSTALKQAYIKSVTDAHDLAVAALAKAKADAATAAMVKVAPLKVKKPWHLYTIIIIETITIALLLILGK
jgi:cell wall-associated NlpC family hydrolase